MLRYRSHRQPSISYFISVGYILTSRGKGENTVCKARCLALHPQFKMRPRLSVPRVFVVIIIIIITGGGGGGDGVGVKRPPDRNATL